MKSVSNRLKSRSRQILQLQYFLNFTICRIDFFSTYIILCQILVKVVNFVKLNKTVKSIIIHESEISMEWSFLANWTFIAKSATFCHFCQIEQNCQIDNNSRVGNFDGTAIFGKLNIFYEIGIFLCRIRPEKLNFCENDTFYVEKIEGLKLIFGHFEVD